MFKYFRRLFFGTKDSNKDSVNGQTQCEEAPNWAKNMNNGNNVNSVSKNVNKRHKDSDEFKKSVENWVENAAKRTKTVSFADSILTNRSETQDFTDIDLGVD